MKNIKYNCRTCEVTGIIKNKYVSYDFDNKIEFIETSDGIIHQVNPPTVKKIKEFFNSKSFLKQPKDKHIEGYLDYIKEEPIRNKTSIYRVNKLTKIINFKEKVKLLKIGCGTGSFIYHISKIQGVKSTGIELSKYFSTYGKEKYNVDILNQDYLETKIQNQDVIIMFNVIENLYNLDETIDKIYKDLNPDGKFIINYVPLKNLFFRIFKEKYFIFRPPIYHIFMNQKSIETYLYKRGFILEKTFYDIRYLSIEKILTLLKLKKLNNFFKFLSSSNLSFKIWAYPSKILVLKKI